MKINGNIRIYICLTALTALFINWQVPENLPLPVAMINRQADSSIAFIRNKSIGRGINFGNALEAPVEGAWGMVIRESYVQVIADAGFNSVRLPICWSAHTDRNYPYAIDPAFLSRVDEVMDWCLDRNLAVIITIHHFDDLYNYPDNAVYLNMFFAIWKQLSGHYKSTDPDRLFFEVLNEPEINLTADKWNLLIPQIIDTIRAIDGDRTLIIDGPDYAYHGSLVKLSIPENEQNVIVSTRYYLPLQFTHQGAWWMADMDQYAGTTWSGTDSERNTVLTDIALIGDWLRENNRPVTIGEYGSIMYADNQSRLTWTNYVRRQFEEKGFSWSYFDFGVIFKAYNITENKWMDGFVEALTGPGDSVPAGW
jgi:endoglucanase